MAALQSELRALREAHRALGEDNRACYAQVRAKDKQLDAAAVQVEEARRIKVENGVRNGSSPAHGKSTFVDASRVVLRTPVCACAA